MRFALLATVLAVAFTGCDASEPFTASGDAAPIAPAAPFSSSVAADSADILVTFVSGVTDPITASETVFTGQDVRRRGYIQETTPGVAITIPLSDLPLITALLDLSPLVASYEDDIAIALPEVIGDTVPLRHDYTGALSDLVLGDDPTFSGQMLPWSVRLIGGHKTDTDSGDGNGTVDMDVYVIDSGVDHPDINVVESVTFFHDDQGPGSSLHGTHVAGIIAAKDDDTGMVGIAPGARIHSLDVFDASGQARISQIIQAVEHVIAAKRAEPSRPMVINMSLGARTNTADYNALDRAVQAAIDERIPVVVSAGNEASSAAGNSPAHVHDAITVGAVDYDHNFAFDFSNHGLRVDVQAPGVRVISTADGGQYARLDGTSMAAPHVTGAVALILSATPGASPAAVQGEVRRNGRNTVDARPPRTINRTIWIARL